MKIIERIKAESFLFWHLTLPCYLWQLRGLDRCEKHGFNNQSWKTGNCFECYKESFK